MPPCRMTQNYHVRKKKNFKISWTRHDRWNKKAEKTTWTAGCFLWRWRRQLLLGFQLRQPRSLEKSSLTQQIKTQSGSFLGNTSWFSFFFFFLQLSVNHTVLVSFLISSERRRTRQGFPQTASRAQLHVSRRLFRLETRRQGRSAPLRGKR